MFSTGIHTTKSNAFTVRRIETAASKPPPYAATESKEREEKTQSKEFMFQQRSSPQQIIKDTCQAMDFEYTNLPIQ